MSSSSSIINNHTFSGFPLVMGVVNVTPDSFSDGGASYSPERAIEHGRKLASQGAQILDVGGESSRPGAEVVDIDEEIARVVPVIEGLKGCAPWISIDTRNARTMEAALKAGANCINDISALSHDKNSVHVVAEANVPVFLMHMQGTPNSMQEKPIYNNVVNDIFNALKERISYCETHRIDPRMIVIDPGVGFGKTLEHNLLILSNISQFHDLSVPILLGTSRKSFIAALSNDEAADNRIGGSVASALWGLSRGVHIFRVHDVEETAQAFKIFQAINNIQSS